MYALCHDVLLLGYGMTYTGIWDFGHNTQPYIQYGINPFSSTYPVQGHSESYREQIASLSQGSVTGKHSLYIHTYGQFRTTI